MTATNDSTLRTMSVLTEHLQYPPVSLIDDIINAVNAQMYNFTAEMEQYLLNRRTVEGKDYGRDIKYGVKKFESIFEHSIDKNFDKLELYILRNILRVPQDLLDSNSFRLKYQMDLQICNKTELANTSKELRKLLDDIDRAMDLNRKIRRKIKRAKEAQLIIASFKQTVLRLLECKDEEESRRLFDSLKPLNDSLKRVGNELHDLYVESEEYASTDKVNAIMEDSPANAGYLPSSRSRYLETNIKAILHDDDDDKTAPEPYSVPENDMTQEKDLTASIQIENPDLSLFNPR